MIQLSIACTNGDLLRLAVDRPLVEARADLAEQVRQGAVVMVTPEGASKIIPTQNIASITITGAR